MATFEEAKLKIMKFALAPYVFINGEFKPPVNGKKFDTYRPTTGEVLTQVAAADKDDVDLAVKAAKTCLYSDNWGYKSTGKQRAVILRKLSSIFEERKCEISLTDVIDEGKPYREAEADVDDAIGLANHFADLAEKQDEQQDEFLDVGTSDFQCKVRYEPIGVVAAITPWYHSYVYICSYIYTYTYTHTHAHLQELSLAYGPMEGNPMHCCWLLYCFETIGIGLFILSYVGSNVQGCWSSCWCPKCVTRTGS